MNNKIPKTGRPGYKPVAKSLFLGLLGFALFFLRPSPNWLSGSHYITFFAIFIFFVLTIFFIGFNKKLLITNSIGFYLPLAYLPVITLSFAYNYEILRPGALAELGRPLFMFASYVFAYLSIKNVNPIRTIAKFTKLCKIILGIQLAVTAIQIYSPQLLSFIWSAEKTRGFGQILRVTGTLPNPNVLGITATLLAALLLSVKPSKSNYLWVAISGLLVLTSGSRSNLLIWPIIVVFASKVDNKINPISLIKQVLFVILIFSFLLSVISHYSTTFKYLSQILNVIETGDLTSVNAIKTRLEMWELRHSVLKREGAHAYVIGLGAPELLRATDNDYLFVFFKFGLLGLILHFFVIWKLFRISIKDRLNNPFSRWLLSSLVSMLIFGLTSETINGWLLSIILFYITGLSAGLHKAQLKFNLPDLVLVNHYAIGRGKKCMQFIYPMVKL